MVSDAFYVTLSIATHWARNQKSIQTRKGML